MTLPSSCSEELQDQHGAGLGPEVTEADYFQGYLFAKALPEQELPSVVGGEDEC